MGALSYRWAGSPLVRFCQWHPNLQTSGSLPCAIYYYNRLGIALEARGGRVQESVFLQRGTADEMTAADTSYVRGARTLLLRGSSRT